MSEDIRLLLDPVDGERYRVRIAPREMTGARGVSPFLNSVVFETEAGAWVGAVPISSPVALQDLSEAELRKMLQRAKATGQP